MCLDGCYGIEGFTEYVRATRMDGWMNQEVTCGFGVRGKMGDKGDRKGKK